MKIELNKKFKDLSGKEVGGDLMNSIVANTLVQGKSDSTIKVYDMATTIFKDGIIELDSTDFDLLFKTIEDSEGLTTMGKAQILKELKSQKKE